MFAFIDSVIPWRRRNQLITFFVLFFNQFTLAILCVVMYISFPGAADQTFHADTPHLYEHVHLPPHYVDLFMPATTTGTSSGDPKDALVPLEVNPSIETFKVGQTAFVCGSHKLDCSARICYKERSQLLQQEFADRTLHISAMRAPLPTVHKHLHFR